MSHLISRTGTSVSCQHSKVISIFPLLFFSLLMRTLCRPSFAFEIHRWCVFLLIMPRRRAKVRVDEKRMLTYKMNIWEKKRMNCCVGVYHNKSHCLPLTFLCPMCHENRLFFSSRCTQLDSLSHMRIISSIEQLNNNNNEDDDDDDDSDDDSLCT